MPIALPSAPERTELLLAAAELFKALGEPTRLRLAALLATQGELCVCQLAAALHEPDFKISRHLTILRNAGLVTTRRHGTWIYYRFAPAAEPFQKSLQALLRRSFADTPGLQD
ncbi:MAG TPA: metalloregulator ArsR/SmtB family transcription factor, partial [Planctomycetota bacterium]|nr:metalloregulator ArsR/SmtB family transcription factor [Planctomycetota bacterium]